MSANYLEYLLLIAVAGIGLAGSLFVFSECPDADMKALHTSVLHNGQNDVAAITHSKIDKWITITGERIVGRKLQIEWKAPREDARYVLDMGNGERVMLRPKKFDYIYTEAGDYTITFRQIHNSLISIVGTTDIKIAPDSKMATSIIPEK